MSLNIIRLSENGKRWGITNNYVRNGTLDSTTNSDDLFLDWMTAFNRTPDPAPSPNVDTYWIDYVTNPVKIAGRPSIKILLDNTKRRFNSDGITATFRTELRTQWNVIRLAQEWYFSYSIHIGDIETEFPAETRPSDPSVYFYDVLFQALTSSGPKYYLRIREGRFYFQHDLSGSARVIDLGAVVEGWTNFEFYFKIGSDIPNVVSGDVVGQFKIWKNGSPALAHNPVTGNPWIIPQDTSSGAELSYTWSPTTRGIFPTTLDGFTVVDFYGRTVPVGRNNDPKSFQVGNYHPQNDWFDLSPRTRFFHLANLNWYIPQIGDRIEDILVALRTGDDYDPNTIIGPYALNLSVNNPAFGTVSRDPISNPINQGVSITITANPTSGYMFSAWKENTIDGVTLSTNPTYVFNMPSNDLTIIAVFILIPIEPITRVRIKTKRKN
jgi:hypothetical protein